MAVLDLACLEIGEILGGLLEQQKEVENLNAGYFIRVVCGIPRPLWPAGAQPSHPGGQRRSYVMPSQLPLNAVDKTSQFLKLVPQLACTLRLARVFRKLGIPFTAPKPT